MAKNLPGITEDKRENATIYGTYRLNAALDAIRILGNCGDRNSYEFTEAQLTKIEDELRAAVEATMKRLRTGERPTAPKVSL